jgi:hypothetical protein
VVAQATRLVETIRVPRAAETLLEALDRYPYGRREDRLTEVLATTLETLPELSAWLLETVDAPSAKPGTRVEVSTQRSRAGSGRPDMFIDYSDAESRPCRVLSEHKLNAEPTGYQRQAYAQWEECDKKVLIAPERYRDIDVFDKQVTWLEVALEVNRLGVQHGGSDWRKTALDPDQPSRLRLLLEALDHIARQDVGVSSMAAIDHNDIEAYARIHPVRETMRNFIEMVRDDPRVLALGPSEIQSERQETQWWFALEVPPPRYLATLDPECGAQIALQPRDDWLEDMRDEPVLYSGFYFAAPEERLPEVLCAQGSSVAAALREADVKVGLHPGHKQAKCAATCYLSDIPAMGGTLSEQAGYAAGWAAAALQAISRIDA